VHLPLKLILTATALSAIALAQNAPSDGPFQVKYASNLDVADADIFFTNTGVNVDPITGIGDICVNTYTFASDEQLASCCTCLVTRNSLWYLSANHDLIQNILTPDPNIAKNGIVVKMLATLPVGGACDASKPGPATRGMAAWGTTFHATTTVVPGKFAAETRFTNSTLSPGEQSLMTSYCGFIKANGSGFGICAGCRLNPDVVIPPPRVCDDCAA
jgi:hypothetical protein